MGCACTKPASIHESAPSPKGKPSHRSLDGFADAPAKQRAAAGVTADDGDPSEKEKKRRKSSIKQNEKLGTLESTQPVAPRRKDRRSVRVEAPSNVPKHREGEQVAAGWPAWLSAVAGEAINGWIPRRADSFEKLDKIGQGTYSNVYKARDLDTGNIVALKKVRFDNLEPESVRFMAREILVLRRLDHPNVVKLEGLVTSRMSCSLYLVFEYMEHDLAGLAACSSIAFTEPQVKCYMQQLLSGLDHCHTRHVLHRDIKGSNLLIDNSGILKIADFGLATFFHPDQRQPLTSRVVTLWYRPPELLLGATEYGVGVDLWSTGCILAELLAGKPILPGRTEVEQLHMIFKLCGSPSEDYWKQLKVPHATMFKFQQPYKRCINETFKNFPLSALSLLDNLLGIEPVERGTAESALKSEFFSSEPHACDPSSLPKYPPSKEIDAKMRDEETRRQRAGAGKSRGDTSKRVAGRDRGGRAIPAPEANAELQVNLQRRRVIAQSHAKSKSEKFPPAHEDGVVGFPMEHSRQGQVHGDGRPRHLVPTTLVSQSGPMGSAAGRGSRRKKRISEDVRNAPPRVPVRSLKAMTVTDFSVSGDFSSMSALGPSKRSLGSSKLKPDEERVDVSLPLDLGNASLQSVQDHKIESEVHLDEHAPEEVSSPAN